MTIRKRINGIKHLFGGYSGGWIPPGAVAPNSNDDETILNIWIEETDGAFYLKWESSNPKFVSSDSWHRTLDEAIEHARGSFGVAPEDWFDA